MCIIPGFLAVHLHFFSFVDSKNGDWKLGSTIVFNIDDAPETLVPEVPTNPFWQGWFANNISELIPLDAQTELNFAYATADPRAPRTFVDVYGDVTGCRVSQKERRRTGVTYFPNPRDAYDSSQPEPLKNVERVLKSYGCHDSYIEAALQTVPKAGSGFPNEECLNAYFKSTPYAKRTAAGVRAVLDICFDSSSLNAGDGLAWDTVSSPFSCKPLDRQTNKERSYGTEFVLPNFDISSIAAGIRSITYESLRANHPNPNPDDPACEEFKKDLTQEQINFLTKGYEPKYCRKDMDNDFN